MAGCCQTQVGSGCCVLWPSVGSWQWAGHALWQCQGKARRAGVQTCSCLCSSPANGMGLGRPYGTCEKTGGSGGWHAESPGSLPLEIKQDRARPTWSPHDHPALWMCLLVGMETHLHQQLPSAHKGPYHCFRMFYSIDYRLKHFF